MKPPPDLHYRHRFPADVISHAVWLYHVFSLSLRDVELLLAERADGAALVSEIWPELCLWSAMPSAAAGRQVAPR